MTQKATEEDRSYWIAVYDKELQHRVNSKYSLTKLEAGQFCKEESNLDKFWLFVFKGVREFVWTNKPIGRT